MKKIITHNGGFHADDVFACATLSLFFKDEKIEIIRTRDEEIIKTGDIVLDIGQKYDGEKFFDHHQAGGAGKRENGIPFASFGLIWKKFGAQLTDESGFKYIDETLVQTVDAIDNGVDISENSKIKIFSVSDCIGCFNLVGHEGKDDDKKHDGAFFRAVTIAEAILERVLIESKDYSDSMIEYKKAYDSAEDERLVVLDNHVRKDVISSIPEVIYVVHPYHNSTWTIRATRKNNTSFESKKPFPIEWAGKSAAELQKITGVSDALFCHNGRFIVNAKTKEGAIELAKLALNAN